MPMRFRIPVLGASPSAFGRSAIIASVAGVTAAAAGAIGGAAFVLARRSIVDIPTAVIAVVTFGVLLRLKKAPEPAVILAAGAVGLIVKAVSLG